LGGLVTAELLSAALGNEHQITLVAPNRMFTFYPGLVQLAFGAYTIEDVRFDLQARLSELKIHFVQGNVTGIDGYDCTVDITGDDYNGTMGYDFLVLATGPKLAIDRVPGFFENSHHLLGVNPALRFGQAVQDFKGGNIVLGLCPDAKLPVAVCETAFALANRFEMEMAAEDVNIRVIFPDSLESAFGGAQFSAQLEKAFSKHGINVLYDIPISEVTPSEVDSSKGHRIGYDYADAYAAISGPRDVQDSGSRR
jgi:sulfide:quinone oxidoreductase